MKETLVVSTRGQITLPAALRRRFGIKAGGVIILEERGNEVVLKPGAVVEIDLYTDEQITEWDTDDILSDQERAQILTSVASRGE